MTVSAPDTAPPTSRAGGYGDLLRRWRRLRRMSQLELSLEAEVSSKHISFLETGRAQPSREMVLRLADVLDVPLRQTNVLLRAAGFTESFRHTAFDDPELAPVRRSLELLLAGHDPFPAVAMDAHWNVLLQNDASRRLLDALLDPEDLATLAKEGPLNLLEVLFHPRGVRPWVVNWDEVAGSLVRRLHHEIALRGFDPEGEALLRRVLANPGVPDDWQAPPLEEDLPVVLPLHLQRDALELRLFTALTTLGTALDVTLGELVIETFLPADATSEQVLRSF